jgi:hypothetical protein
VNASRHVSSIFDWLAHSAIKVRPKMKPPAYNDDRSVGLLSFIHALTCTFFPALVGDSGLATRSTSLTPLTQTQMPGARKYSAQIAHTSVTDQRGREAGGCLLCREKPHCLWFSSRTRRRQSLGSVRPDHLDLPTGLLTVDQQFLDQHKQVSGYGLAHKVQMP